MGRIVHSPANSDLDVPEHVVSLLKPVGSDEASLVLLRYFSLLLDLRLKPNHIRRERPNLP